MYWRVNSKTVKKREENKKDTVNAATIWCFARKLRAYEWARALGKRIKDPRMNALEQKAAKYRIKLEKERLRAESRSKELAKYKKRLEIALQDLNREPYAMAGSNPSDIIGDLEEALRPVGMVAKILSVDRGYDLWIEPWEEQRLRGQHGGARPAIYKVEIDDQLKVVSFAQLEDAEEISRAQMDMWAKLLQKPLDDEILGDFEDRNKFEKILDARMSKIGLVFEIIPSDEMWTIRIEPWEEARVRNLQRKGGPPIVIYRLCAKLIEGKIELISAEREGEVRVGNLAKEKERWRNIREHSLGGKTYSD